jgi:hypothetical protein
MVNKKVLFIGIGFYDYEYSIISEFNKLNYDVDYFCEVPQNTIKFRYYSRLKNEKKITEINKFHNLKIIQESGSNYDLVFIIKCENITLDTLNFLRKKNPKANFVLYLWDSIQRIKNVESKFIAFDKVYSFDRLDCLNNSKLLFNPLFYREEYRKNNKEDEYIYDVYHLGWYHSDRLHIIKNFAVYCNNNNLKYKFLLFTGFFSFLIQFIIGGELRTSLKYLIFKPLSSLTNRRNILCSKVILDIAHPDQSGLTMRTIELIGMQKKIITTNKDIINYDFYHPDNIFIMDRESTFIDRNFIDSDYVPLSFDLINRYSINQWLKRML